MLEQDQNQTEKVYQEPDSLDTSVLNSLIQQFLCQFPTSEMSLPALLFFHTPKHM